MINLDLSVLVTIAYLIVLYLFMSRVFFGPILRVLEERRQLIVGRSAEAQDRLLAAERKAAAYEASLQSARAEAYREQETLRQKTLQQREELISRARAESEAEIDQAKKRIAAEAAKAEEELQGSVALLAERLSAQVLHN